MLIQDLNAKIQKCGNMFEIIDITTGDRHQDCKINLFETYELAVNYMKSEEDVKVQCGACYDISMLSEWKCINSTEGEVQCPFCWGEFKDMMIIKEGMEAGLNCPNCLSENTEINADNLDNKCLDCGFECKISNAIAL